MTGEVPEDFKGSPVVTLAGAARRGLDTWKSTAKRLAEALHRLHYAVEFWMQDTYQNEGPDAQDMIQAKEALAEYEKLTK